MYSVSKHIEFCYGHRLVGDAGLCGHPHGHNATAEIEIRADSLDHRNMVVDFGDIKRVVKDWVDRNLDHKMILRRDDPLLKPLEQLGEPVFVVEENPTAEIVAKLIFDFARSRGFRVMCVKVWETPNSYAAYDGDDRDTPMND